MKRWVTLYPPASNEHLKKDVGAIPRQMARLGWQAQLVSSNPGLKKEKAGSKDFTTTILDNKGKIGFLEKSVIAYIRKCAKRIDVLHLFHISRDTMVYGYLFKRANPQGYLYIKCDAYNEQLKQPRIKHSKTAWKQAFLHALEKRFFKMTHLFSIENPQGLQLLKELYPTYSHKFIELPNGVSVPEPKTPVSRKNIFLTVGRLGGEGKNYEMLFKILPHIKWNGWKMRCIGPESEAFQKKRKQFFEAHPSLENHVEFTGAITGRKALATEYNAARVFFLLSFRESFGLALAEALKAGCYLLGTPGMSAFETISAGGKFGETCRSDDPHEFINTFNVIAAEKKTPLHSREEAINYAMNRFSWNNITARLDERISEEIGR